MCEGSCQRQKVYIMGIQREMNFCVFLNEEKFELELQFFDRFDVNRNSVC